MIVSHFPVDLPPEDALSALLGLSAPVARKLMGIAVEHTSHLNEIKAPYQAVNILRLLEHAGSSMLHLAVASRAHSLGSFASAAEADNGIRVAIGVGHSAMIRSLSLVQSMRIGGSLRGQKGQPSEAVLKTLVGQVAGGYALSAGYASLAKLVETQLPSHPKEVGPVDFKSTDDFKSALLEYAQSKGHQPKYTVISESGPDHSKSFTVEVRAEPGRSAQGTGPSKKQASQDAATRYLRQFAPHFEKITPQHSGHRSPSRAEIPSGPREVVLQRLVADLGLPGDAVRVLNTALTHSSYRIQNKHIADNTVLANLGSWVLDASSSFRLLILLLKAGRLGEDNKNFRSTIASIVSKSNTHLQQAFDALDLGRLLKTGPAIKEVNLAMKAEAFQAVLGALFIARPDPELLIDVLPPVLLKWLDEAILQHEPKLADANLQQRRESHLTVTTAPATGTLSPLVRPAIVAPQGLPTVKSDCPRVAPRPSVPLAAAAVASMGKITRALTPKPPTQTLQPCKRCGAHVRQEFMDKHLKWCGSEESQRGVGLRVPTERLPFTLLPPGTWEIRQVVEHYREAARRGNSNWGDRVVDRTRLEKIAGLRPIRCYVGRDSWTGYVIFEFARTKRVVLECPIEGNATYVLYGDWRKMVGRTKAEIRQVYSRQHIRIVHRGDWLLNIRKALR